MSSTRPRASQTTKSDCAHERRTLRCEPTTPRTSSSPRCAETFAHGSAAVPTLEVGARLRVSSPGRLSEELRGVDKHEQETDLHRRLARRGRGGRRPRLPEARAEVAEGGQGRYGSARSSGVAGGGL